MKPEVVTTETPYQRGYEAGLKDRGTDKRDIWPPYKTGSLEASEWLRGYKAGRFPNPGPSEIKNG